MNDQPYKAPDFLELLISALAERVKKSIEIDLNEHIRQEVRSQIGDAEINTDNIEGLEKYIDNRIEDYASDFTVEADNVKGLEEFVSSGIEEYMRHGDGRKMDADDVDGLETMVESIINNGSFSFNS